MRSCNGGEVTDRPQDPTYGKRSRQIPDIKKIGAIRESPKKFAAGQGAGTGRNPRYQKIEGVRVVEGAPVSPVREDMTRHNSCQGYMSALRASLTAIAPGRVLVANR